MSVDRRSTVLALGTARYVTMSLIALVLLLPLIWLVISSLRPPADIFAHGSRLGWSMLIPDRLTLENYTSLIGTGFPRAVGNSLFVALTTMVVGVVVNAAAGFAFAVFDFRFKNLIFAFVLAAAMMPFEAIVIPLYILVQSLGLIDTYAALILPDLANGFVIFMFRQFFAGLPRELYEAARVDGASWGHIWLKIALPISWPVVLTGGIMLFMHQFEAFFWPLVATPSPEHTVVQVAIARNISLEGTEWGRLFSSTTLAGLVALVPFLLFQKFYIRNFVTSGLK
ncbi:carbohydrate ABC transporter permease [Bosea sp. NPDC003192]|uniref:carbohydrate ABC transporter permease n=1 Tax=Bosea sp. NPDC003192 TaxID=3390551 RepID=UPI003D059E39